MTLLETTATTPLDASLIASLSRIRDLSRGTVLMFSGGRDSTLAALRICDQGHLPILVTISSWHLQGIERVRERVREIERYLPVGVPWLIIRQPEELKTDTSFYEQTCLPCQHAYVVAGAAVAAKAGIKKLAFGYAGYQNSWPEQTPVAIERLSLVLRNHNIELIVPVYDLASREQALQELKAAGLSTDSLEQKCLRQVTNVALGIDRLNQQINLWERAIDTSMSALDSIDIQVIEIAQIGLR